MVDQVLIETSVLVHYANGHVDAEAYVQPLMRHRVARIHPISIAELIVGVHNRSELRHIEGIVASIEHVAIKNVDFGFALGLIRQHHLSHRLGWPDAVIAATALRIGIPLATLNDRHFRLTRGLRVVRPY